MSLSFQAAAFMIAGFRKYLLFGGVGLAVCATLLFAYRWLGTLDIQNRTANRVVAKFDSLPLLPGSVVETREVRGNWKFRSASVTRLFLTDASLDEVCEFYSSRLKALQWAPGNAGFRCDSQDNGVFRIAGWFPSLNSDEQYTVLLFAEATERAKWGGVWYAGPGSWAHFEHAVASGHRTMFQVSIMYVEDARLRDSPCRSWEDSSCEDGAWQSSR